MNACTWGEGGHIPHLDGWVGEGVRKTTMYIYAMSDFKLFKLKVTFTYTHLFNVDHSLIILVNFQ